MKIHSKHNIIRNDEVRLKLHHQSSGDLLCLAFTDEPLLLQVVEQGDDAEIICVGIHSTGLLLICVITKTPKHALQTGLGAFVMTFLFYRIISMLKTSKIGTVSVS